jgi:hypothetical protein
LGVAVTVVTVVTAAVETVVDVEWGGRGRCLWQHAGQPPNQRDAG